MLFCYRIALDYLTEKFTYKQIAGMVRVDPATVWGWKHYEERLPRSMEHTREVMYQAYKRWLRDRLFSIVTELDNKLDDFRAADYLRRAGLSNSEIGRVLGKNRSTIGRRLNKGKKPHSGYKPIPGIKVLSREKRESIRDETFWGCYPIISKGHRSADWLLKVKRKRSVAEMAMEDTLLDKLRKKYLKGNKKALADY